ncbi:MAG: penicillin acylase family protein [Candidatus Eisenbacteria bacterium]|uniref:Penicillin acylase family protein n=1 Tax=Eiseniibacteriota bacterium TaxID=2212470 RepID=A0A538TIT2_UNCEI|nr:MAG: penicillin acylase family protein [Candidatus Eisenbacteria bacterium]
MGRRWIMTPRHLLFSAAALGRAALLAVLATAGATATGCSGHPAGSPASRGGQLTVPGLQERVTVQRDARGIPYLSAAGEHDLFFAQGFVTADDRLWQMDLLRRTARGELAEILGDSVLEQDAQVRGLGFGALADGLVARVSPPMQQALAAYAEGVNAWIAAHADHGLPAEFRLLGYKPKPWLPADSLVIGKLFALDLSHSWSLDILRNSFGDLPEDRRTALFPEASPLDVVLVGGGEPPPVAGKPASAALPQPEAYTGAWASQSVLRRALNRVGLFADLAAASNSWVIGGARSVTGKPILANDPHLAPSAPSIWYLTHLSAPGIHVAGVTTPGVVGILIGHNERIAWGVTNLMADVQDLYAETFDAAGRYATPSGPRAALMRKERILVRSDKPDAGIRTVEREVTVTRHGPLVFKTDGWRLALRWTALDPDASEVAAFLDIDKASDWIEFTAALKNFAGPPLNFVYADAAGHIGYYAAGRIPARASGDGTVPYDGATDAGEWSGYVPFGELPHLFDPPSGVIVTANNRIVGGSYRHLITRAWTVPYRAHRIWELLAANPKLSADDFQAIQADTYAYADATFARAVVEVARSQAALSGEWTAMAKTFDGWNGRASADSRVLPLAVAMRRVFVQKILEAALGADRAKEYQWPNRDTLIDQIATSRPAAWLPKEYSSYADLLLACWKEGRADLARRAGTDETQWTWGHVGRPVRFPHPLGELPQAGTRFTVDPLPKATEGSSETVNAGMFVSMRFVADLFDWDRSRQGIALGESGDPSSPHWKDQLADWRSVTTRTFPFSPAAVARAAVETQVLVPPGKGPDGDGVAAPPKPR